MRNKLLSAAIVLLMAVPIHANAQVMKQPAPKDRKTLACEESFNRYMKDKCDQNCTSACKKRGAALRKCDVKLSCANE